MRIVDVKTAPEKSNAHNVSVRTIYDMEHAQAAHIELKPGESLKKHITSVDVFFYILEGNGIVEIGDESKEVRQDMLIESPAHIPHRLINPNGGIFRILVVKMPRPADSAKVL